MAFQAEPATYSDLDAIAGVVVDAHVNDSLFVKLMPGVPRETLVKWYADAFRKVWEEQKWGKYYKVVELETGKIMGMSQFHYPHAMNPEERANGESNPHGPLPEGSNTELCKLFFEQLEEYEQKYLDREKIYFVHYLSVLPEYHRKGFGGMLMDICLKDADEANAKTFLIATPAGSGLYRKLGFQEVDSMTWELRPYGGDIITWHCMMRRPNADRQFIEIENLLDGADLKMREYDDLDLDE